MSLKSKKTMADIKARGLRTGDVVKRKCKWTKEWEFGIVGEIDAWWLLENTIEVFFPSESNRRGTVTHYDDLKVALKREEIKKNWWELTTDKQFNDLVATFKK